MVKKRVEFLFIESPDLVDLRLLSSKVSARLPVYGTSCKIFNGVTDKVAEPFCVFVTVA